MPLRRTGIASDYFERMQNPGSDAGVFVWERVRAAAGTPVARSQHAMKLVRGMFVWLQLQIDL
jgi:hypothetical protein